MKIKEEETRKQGDKIEDELLNGNWGTKKKKQMKN